MSDVRITVPKNGPYLVKGAHALVGVDGEEIDVSDRKTVALCRCGQSENKPFCDGAHSRCGWTPDG